MATLIIILWALSLLAIVAHEFKAGELFNEWLDRRAHARSVEPGPYDLEQMHPAQAAWHRDYRESLATTLRRNGKH